VGNRFVYGSDGKTHIIRCQEEGKTRIKELRERGGWIERETSSTIHNCTLKKQGNTILHWFSRPSCHIRRQLQKAKGKLECSQNFQLESKESSQRRTELNYTTTKTKFATRCKEENKQNEQLTKKKKKKKKREREREEEETN